jgi:hypothetical protein
MQLIFDRNVFSNKGKTYLGEIRIRYLTSLIKEYSLNESFLLDEGNSPRVARSFREFSSCRPLRGANDEKLDAHKFPRERRQFKNQAFRKIWTQREHWLNYWDKNFGIKHEYCNLEPYGKFTLKDIQKHFLIGMFYLNMINSIVVDYKKFAQLTWRERHIENSQIMKRFAQSFQEILENVAQNEIKNDGLNSWASVKCFKTQFPWLHMRNWLRESGRYKFLYEWIKDLVNLNIDLFDDVFGYSISNLSIILSQ